jgi:hypothetical protein
MGVLPWRLGYQGWQGALACSHPLTLDLNDPEMIFMETGKPLSGYAAEELGRAAAHLAPPLPKAKLPTPLRPSLRKSCQCYLSQLCIHEYPF